MNGIEPEDLSVADRDDLLRMLFKCQSSGDHVTLQLFRYVAGGWADLLLFWAQPS